MDVDLNACTSGDGDAWGAFVDRWAGVIYAAVRRASGAADRADVEDAVQDVFLRLVKDDYRLLRSYDPSRASLATWLTLVARSTAIDRLRRRTPATSPLEAAEAAAAPAPREPPEVPLHLLSARQRLVLRLLFDEGLGVAEAARFMGVDEQTVRSAKHKALTRLREHFSR